MNKEQLMICSSALTSVLALSGRGNKAAVKNPPKDALKKNNSNQAKEDFTAFDLEVQFEDGSKKEYKINP